MDLSGFNLAGTDSTTALDAEDVFNRHQERLVDLPHRLGNIAVDLLHQFEDALRGGLILGTLKSLEGRALDDRSVITGKIVFVEQLTNLHLDKLEKLIVIDLVNLVHEHHDARHLHLARKQDVLASLGHGTVGSAHHQDGSIHLGGTGNHVLHIVGVTGTIDMRVVTIFRLVLDMRRVDRNSTLTLFRGVIDGIKRTLRSQALAGKGLGDRRG